MVQKSFYGNYIAIGLMGRGELEKAGEVHPRNVQIGVLV
jgi:hypothetical protein